MVDSRLGNAFRRLLNCARGFISPDRRSEPFHFNSMNFARGAVPGSLAADVFDKIRAIPGWFNYDDCANFSLLLATQSLLGVGGDICEIGSYYGRSTCLLAHLLRPGERLLVCDAFEGNTHDPYARRPTPEVLWSNLLAVNPGLSPASVDIHSCHSLELKLEPGTRFRFAHVDGGHELETALFDLNLCVDHLIGGGVLAVDDYAHRDWPDVTKAVDAFLTQRKDCFILADLNRHGAIGRKIYLCRRLVEGD